MDSEQLYTHVLFLAGSPEALVRILMLEVWHTEEHPDLGSHWQLRPYWSETSNIRSVDRIRFHEDSNGLINAIEFKITANKPRLQAFQGKNPIENFGKNFSRSYPEVEVTLQSFDHAKATYEQSSWGNGIWHSGMADAPYVPGREREVRPVTYRYVTGNKLAYWELISVMMEQGDQAAAQWVKQLVKHGPMHFSYGTGWSALQWAAWLELEETARTLMAHEAEPLATGVDSQDHLFSPLSIAALSAINSGNPTMFAEMLSKSDPTKEPVRYGVIYKWLAQEHVHPDVLNAFFEHVDALESAGQGAVYQDTLSLLLEPQRKQMLMNRQCWIAERAAKQASPAPTLRIRRL